MSLPNGTTPGPVLPDWLAQVYDFSRVVVKAHGRRIHLVDDGEGPVVVLQHGNPAWSFLYRHIMGALKTRGFRVIAPDLFGFGFSDKPRDPRAHELKSHTTTIAEVLKQRGVRDAIIVGQDWGGPIVVGAAVRADLNVRGVVLGNTAVVRPARPFRTKSFHRFSHIPVLSDVAFRHAQLLVRAMPRVQNAKLPRVAKRAYMLPFRKLKDRAGPLGLARMVPNAETHSAVAELDIIHDALDAWHAPMSLVWGRNDPVLGRTLRRHQRAFPHATVHETRAGHFLQEEVPDAFVQAIVEVHDKAETKHH